MTSQYSRKAPKRAAKPGSRIPASVREDFLNSVPAISTAAGPITYRMSCWFPGKLVGGVPVPDPNAAAEVVTGAPETPEMGLIPDPSVAPEESKIHPIASDTYSAIDQVGISTGFDTPPALLRSGGSEQPLPCVPELHEPSYMSDIGDVCAAFPVTNHTELSPFIQDMKDFDAIKAATPNTLAIGQTQDAIAWLKVPDNTSTAGVNTVAENTQLQTSIHPSIPAGISATPEEIMSRAGSPAPVENSVRSSSPDASLVELEPKECISEPAASAGVPSGENQQQTPPPSTENRQPIEPTGAPLEVGESEIERISHIDSDSIDPSKPTSIGENAGANNDTAPPLESDPHPIDLELVIQQPASTKNLLDGHQLHIPPPIGDDLIFPSPRKVLPVEAGPANKDNQIIELPGAPKANTAEMINEDSNSTGSARAREGGEGTPGCTESSSEDTATISAAMRGNSSPPPSVEAGSANKDNKIIEPSGALAVGVEPMVEETTPAEAPMDESPPQTPTDTTDNYQFPSEERVLARARTAGTALFSRGNANFNDLQDLDEEANIIEPTKGDRFHRPPSSIPSGVKLQPYKSAPLTIPIPDTMFHWFFSKEIPAPKWAPQTLYFRGGRIVDPLDPDYKYFDQVALLPPRLPPSAYVRKTPLPPDNSQDARGLIPPEPREKRIPSIYDFIDTIRTVGDVTDPQIAINAKSVEDFVKAYYIEGPDGRPLLNNPPRGAIPQVKINHEWIPSSVLERYRIERVIRLLDLEISPATRAALFWILIERQTERTRVLLELFAEYPQPKLKDVEKKLISWGYLPEMAQEEEDTTTEEGKRPVHLQYSTAKRVYSITRIPIQITPPSYPLVCQSAQEMGGMTAVMDPKDMIKLDVLKETQQLLDALSEAAGSQRRMKLLLPFMQKYSVHNMGFFGLMGSDKMIELVEELCNCLQAGEEGSDLPSFDVQMGCWSFLDDLRPSVFIARSTYLCDLEYLYVVTKRAEVHSDVLEIVARVMAPILKRISEHDDIPLRREIPEEVKQSLEQTGNAQIARYLEAQLRPVVRPTLRELVAAKLAKVRCYEEEQARLEAIKLEERREVMRARVQYMEEDIPRDLAIRPAEIYSPKRRRRKLLEGKARISRPSKKRASIAGTVGHGEERETLGEAAIASVGTKLRASRKRGREEVLDEIAGPSKASPPRTPTNTRSSKRVRLTTNASTVEERRRPTLHKPIRSAHESDSDVSDSPSAGDGSDDLSGESEEDEEPEARASISASKRGVIKSVAADKAGAVLTPTQVSKPTPARATRAPSPVYGPVRGDLAAPSWILPDLDDEGDETDEEQPRKASTRARKEVRGQGDISDEDRIPEKLSTAVKPRVRTPLRPSAPQPLRRSPRKHQPKPADESDSSSSDEDGDDAYESPQTYHKNKQNKGSTGARQKGSRKNEIKVEKSAQIPARTVKTARGMKGKEPRLPIRRDESDISDVDEDNKSSPPPPMVATSIRQRITESESDTSDEDETSTPIPTAAQPRAHTPPLPPVPQSPLRRSPRKHQPKRKYANDSSSSDKDDSDDYYEPQPNRNGKRIKLSEKGGKRNPRQNAPKAQKQPQPPPTLRAKTKSVAKTAAEKVEARSAAAKRAAATRAANHQALVDKITAELVVEAQRAADAGGYRPSAITKTQVKRQIKREKEKMKREEARERLEAAMAMREESAEAKKIAAAEKQAAAAKKRAATIAAKKAAISVKTEARSQSAVVTKTTNTKIKKGNKAAQEGMVKVKAELAAEAGATPSSDEEDSAASEGSEAEESEDEAELSLAQEISRQEDEAQEKAEILASAARHRKAQREAAAKVKTEAKEARKVGTKKRKQNLAEQEALENQATTLKTLLNTAYPPKKKYAWMEGDDADHGESSRAGEEDGTESGYEANKKGKRRKINPKK